jgi:hypothetical protein
MFISFKITQGTLQDNTFSFATCNNEIPSENLKCRLTKLGALSKPCFSGSFLSLVMSVNGLLLSYLYNHNRFHQLQIAMNTAFVALFALGCYTNHTYSRYHYNADTLSSLLERSHIEKQLLALSDYLESNEYFSVQIITSDTLEKMQDITGSQSTNYYLYEKNSQSRFGGIPPSSREKLNHITLKTLLHRITHPTTLSEKFRSFFVHPVSISC